MSRRVDFECVKSSMESEGYTVHIEAKEYKNNKQKIPYTCPNGHKHSVSWADWNSKGVRCPYCNGRPIISVDDVRSSMESAGYTLLTTSYSNNKSPLEFVCPNGHRHTTTWTKWNSHGYRCPYCYGNAKKTIDEIRADVESAGYSLASNVYGNCHDKLELVCPNGHSYKVSWDNWNSKDSRCTVCGRNGVSKEERSLLDFLSTSYDGEIIHNDYSIIKPKELDIVIPGRKIAIEYCGLYWHSELMGKDRHYHHSKMIRCFSAGYRLITIFSDEFKNHQDVVLSRLSNILGIGTPTVIYARNTKIAEIDATTARAFCTTHHLQGYAGSSVRLGGYHDGKLVSVMTFAKPSISKGARGDHKDAWELSRFCSLTGYRVVGMASKFLAFFERTYPCDVIFSYADCRWSVGNTYERIGFKLTGSTRPNYWYIRDACKERKHRFALRKQPNEPKDITEWELRKSAGWNRIWDCGNLKYVIIN